VIAIDTNVLVFLLLRGDRTEEARRLFAADSEWHSEGFLLVEFSNVLVTYVRSRELALADARRLLTEAERLVQPHLLTVSHSETLELADQYRVSAYDGRFLAITRHLNRPLVTEDEKLRRAAPELTQSITQALRGLSSA
jgi:predicted nucleic acid-binding protein